MLVFYNIGLNVKQFIQYSKLYITFIYFDHPERVFNIYPFSA